MAPKISPADAARWLAKQLEKDTKVVPQGQSKGSFKKGPRAYIVCAKCTQMFSDHGVQVGIPKQQAKAHAVNHKLGLVRKPTEVTTGWTRS